MAPVHRMDSTAVADTTRRATRESIAPGAAGVVRWPRPQGTPSAPPAPIERAKPTATFDQPRWVMLRSLALPGWGQFHNRAWWKGAAIAAGEGALVAGLIQDERELSRLQREIDEFEGDQSVFDALLVRYNQRLDQQIARRWWLGGLVAYALVDAYVDAYFVHFESDFERDPALPEGVRPPTRKLRLFLGWTF